MLGQETIVRSPKIPEVYLDLDELPLPALEYPPTERYVGPLWSGGEDKQMGVMITSRGCPYRCTSCASGADSLLKFRCHGIDRVMVELRRLIEEYQVDFVLFNDDTLTVNRKRCLKIFERMQEEGLCIPFIVTTRVNNVDIELLTAMRGAGCFLVSFAIESGDQRVLDSMGKNTTLDGTRQAVAEAKELGLGVVGDYTFGHWEDTVESCERTPVFATELACDISQFAISIPYPGTRLHTQAVAENRIFPTTDYRAFGYYGNVPWEHLRIKAEALIDLQKRPTS